MFPYMPNSNNALPYSCMVLEEKNHGRLLSAQNERNHLLLDMIKFGSSSLGKIPPMDADFPGFG